MRLICPNCDAQYEVPDEVMPTDGRDVQCSNCGQTWFQHHPDNAPEEDQDRSVDVDAPAPDEEISPPPPPMPRPAEPQRKQLDPAVADILRQEAEAEHEARRKRQSDTLESQPDLGLDSSDKNDSADSEDRRTRQAQERMARMRGEPKPEPVSDSSVMAAAISSRRDLLPDLEEINSTLHNTKAKARLSQGLFAHDLVVRDHAGGLFVRAADRQSRAADRSVFVGLCRLGGSDAPGAGRLCAIDPELA